MSKAEIKLKKPRKVKPVGADGHRQRMIYKFIHTERRYLIRRDVVEMILYYSIAVRDTRDSAVYLMDAYDNKIRAITHAPPKDLEKIDGIGAASARFLNLIGYIGDRMRAPDADKRPRLLTHEEICSYLIENYPSPENDEMWALYFDGAMHPKLFKIKEEPIELYADDLYTLHRLSAINHRDLLILVRMSASECIFPTDRDMLIRRYVDYSIENTYLRLLDYIIVSADEAMSIDKR